MTDCSHLTPLIASAWVEEFERLPADRKYSPDKIARLVEAITYGVEIGYTGDRSQGLSARNAKSTEEPRAAKLISEGIAADVAKGYKRGPFDEPPFSPFWASPLGCVPKGADGIRIIHNLSHPFGGNSVNAGIEREEYKMQRFEDAVVGIRRLGRGAIMTKFDVVAAFKLVPVRPSDYPLLGLRWLTKFYYEVVLPFGLRPSGYRWEEFATALHWLAEWIIMIEELFHYVDDFLFGAPPGQIERALAQRAQFEQMCARLGVPLADEKTVGPSTSVVFLGILIDTELMECRLTDERIAKLRALLQVWVCPKHHFTCDDLMSLVGKLEFATTVIRPGTAFLRRIRAYMMRLKTERETSKSSAVTASSKRLNDEARLDMKWWLNVFLTPAGNRRYITEDVWVHNAELELYTDACDTGYGARFGDRWFQGKWTPEQLAFALVNTRISMPYLELHALVHAAVTWGHLWAGLQITFRCDAEAAVLAVQSMRSRRDSMSALLRLLYATAARHGFIFRCEHFPGKSNIIADALSRGCTRQELLNFLPNAEPQQSEGPDMSELLREWEDPPLAGHPAPQPSHI